MELKRTTFKPRDGDAGALSITLTDWGNDVSEEYVTHHEMRNSKYWGNYFTTLEEATKNYEDRVAEQIRSGYTIDTEWKILTAKKEQS